ncbi:MocR-like pyridoxine biosynthesis transcription factor PdxR [Geminicoccus roseus]|uniref:MocR-like pyridoxine biosynthesis transcription factor PdxR n=1 Tax=Geminicoccus roseus TaxID=404900 RepID=UPI000420CA84|nr:PLP-dependent aminotransferase family protein [Geminicoccus roseus]
MSHPSTRERRAIPWALLFARIGGQGRSLQSRIRQMITGAVLGGHLPAGAAVPSSRALAGALDVARNTVVLAYQQLVAEGFLEPRPRSGFVVAPRVAIPPTRPILPNGSTVAWRRRLIATPSSQRNVGKPDDWQQRRYPFLYGQYDPILFPRAEWRDCVRQAMSVLEVRDWAKDLIDGDDPELIEQLRTRVLPRRGIWAAADEIVITLGAQQALYLLASLLVSPDTTVGIENPGYPDARNILSLRTTRLRPLPVDSHGLVVDRRLDGCDLVLLTPGHQCPTTVTMPQHRREALLADAHAGDRIVIEDDYDTVDGLADEPVPALKSMDKDGRVIHVGSLSKTLAPGLRLGFVVAPAPVIQEARALRRLMLRHPPANNQRALALFLAHGHHETVLRRMRKAFTERARALEDSLRQHLPRLRWTMRPGSGGAWVEGPPDLDSTKLAERALAHDLLLEPGTPFFADADPPRNYFRLGVGSIPTDRIQPGVQLLGRLMRE